MKCVTIRQPWASAILAGLIDVEYRCYPTDYRGDLLIHAGSEITDWDRRQFIQFGRRAPRWQDLVFGKVIGMVELWACDPGRHGEWAWCLRKPRLLEPFAIEPGRRIFDVEDWPDDMVRRTPRSTGRTRQPTTK
jgi:hypothetical protein